MSSVMISGTCWVGCLGDYPGWNVMSPCGSTLGGGAGGVSGVVSGYAPLEVVSFVRGCLGEYFFNFM